MSHTALSGAAKALKSAARLAALRLRLEETTVQDEAPELRRRKTRQTTFRLPEWLLDELEVLAKEQEYSLSGLVIVFLEFALARYKAAHGLDKR